MKAEILRWLFCEGSNLIIQCTNYANKKNFVRDRTSVSILLTHSHLKVIATLHNVIKYTIKCTVNKSDGLYLNDYALRLHPLNAR